jgi:hypothetical protein
MIASDENNVSKFPWGNFFAVAIACIMLGCLLELSTLKPVTTRVDIPVGYIGDLQQACSGTGQGLRSLTYIEQQKSLEATCGNGLTLYKQL